MAEYGVNKGSVANGELVGAWKWVKWIDNKWRTSTLTYSHNITITIVQALVVPMYIPPAAHICRPPLGCFANYRARVLGERMKR